MTNLKLITGPFQTEQEVLNSLKPWPRNRVEGRAVNRELLLSSLHEADVDPGAYGMRVVEWLAHASPQNIIVLADMIQRAHNRRSL